MIWILSYISAFLWLICIQYTFWSIVIIDVLCTFCLSLLSGLDPIPWNKHFRWKWEMFFPSVRQVRAWILRTKGQNIFTNRLFPTCCPSIFELYLLLGHLISKGCYNFSYHVKYCRIQNQQEKEETWQKRNIYAWRLFWNLELVDKNPLTCAHGKFKLPTVLKLQAHIHGIISNSRKSGYWRDSHEDPHVLILFHVYVLFIAFFLPPCPHWLLGIR